MVSSQYRRADWGGDSESCASRGQEKENWALGKVAI